MIPFEIPNGQKKNSARKLYYFFSEILETGGEIPLRVNVRSDFLRPSRFFRTNCLPTFATKRYGSPPKNCIGKDFPCVADRIILIALKHTLFGLWIGFLIATISPRNQDSNSSMAMQKRV